MLVEKKWVKQNCQVGRQIIFLIWIFFFVDFLLNYFLGFSKNGGKTVDPGWVRENFSDFFNGNFEAEKSERSWKSSVWELREFSGKIEKKIRKMGKIEILWRKSKNLKFLEKKIGILFIYLFFVFWLKIFSIFFFKFSLDFFLVNLVF